MSVGNRGRRSLKAQSPDYLLKKKTHIGGEEDSLRKDRLFLRLSLLEGGDQEESIKRVKKSSSTGRVSQDAIKAAKSGA